jgi:hypothetical protein
MPSIEGGSIAGLQVMAALRLIGPHAARCQKQWKARELGIVARPENAPAANQRQPQVEIRIADFTLERLEKFTPSPNAGRRVQLRSDWLSAKATKCGCRAPIPLQLPLLKLSARGN